MVDNLYMHGTQIIFQNINGETTLTRKSVENIGDEDSEFFIVKIAKTVKHHTCGLTNMFLWVIRVVEFDFGGFEIDFGQRQGVFAESYFPMAASTPIQTY